MISPGDMLVAVRDLDDTVRVGDIVQVAEVRANGEYVVLKGAPWVVYRLDGFAAVPEPWWTWVPASKAAFYHELKELVPVLVAGMRVTGALR